jgi:uncharacterized membrane protein YgdD (TMEM256/DUF423 family)
MISILVILAGLMGACGVSLAAAAAHLASEPGPGTGLDSAAYLLVIHAVAVFGGTALASQRLLWRPLALIGLAGWVLGAALFAGDIAMRAFAGHRLFPMAAPSGGTILILSWLVLAGAAIVAMAKGAASRQLGYSDNKPWAGRTPTDR